MTLDSTLRATSLLWEGLYRANVAMVMRALDQGADVNAPFGASGLKNSKFGAEDTPLHGALNPSSKSNGARVAKTSKADVSGVGAIIVMLLERGADVSATNALGETPLTVMCKSNQLKLDAKVENFLIEKSSEAGVLDHQDTVFGNNALHYSANLGRTRLVIRLCKRGANVDIPLRASGGKRTPIFSAFRGAADSFLSGTASQSRMHWLAVDGLLNYHANINARDRHGHTVATAFPRLPLSDLTGRKFNNFEAHPLTGETLLDFHLGRLKTDFVSARNRIDELFELQETAVSNPALGVQHINDALESIPLSEREEQSLLRARAHLEQLALSDTTPTAPKGKGGPRL